MGRYPVLLDLDGVSCLVVGGGSVAARKVRGLLDAGAIVTVCAPELGGALQELAAGRSVTWRADTFDGSAPWGEDIAERGFVVAATDDAAVNAQVVALALARGVWANDATAPDGGPAAIPAVHRQGPITVSVSTGGVHPGAAVWLRDQLAPQVGPEVAVALDLVAELRRESPPTDPSSRPDWRCAVDSGMLVSIRGGHLAEAKERLQACLSSSSD